MDLPLAFVYEQELIMTELQELSKDSQLMLLIQNLHFRLQRVQGQCKFLLSGNNNRKCSIIV